MMMGMIVVCLQYFIQTMQQRQSMQLARRSKLRQSLKQKYYENDNQKPIGKYKLIMNDYHKGQPFLTLGPDYPIFIFSFALVNLLTVLLLHRLNKFEDTSTFFLILTVALIYMDIVWLATALINPGIAAPNSDDEGEICELCQADNGIQVVKEIKERLHCPDCDVCIDGQETHIKLVGGCVGSHNIIVFKLLLLGIFLWGLSMITIVPLTWHIL